MSAQQVVVTQVDPTFRQNLVQALASSLDSSNEIRQQAEQYIKQSQRVPGYCSALLQISADPSVNQGSPVEHAASVQLGTIVEYHWKFLNEEQAKKISIEGFDFIILDEGDKALVRDNIVKCLYQTQNKQIQKQYLRCITTIARFDYPQRWPNIVNEIVQYLSTSEERSVLTGLMGLKGLVKKYEYELQEERAALYPIIASTFGLLGNLVNQSLGAMDNDTALQILLLVCKVFYTSNQLYLCPFLAEGNNVDPWIQFFKTLMDRQMPTELESFVEDMTVIEERDKHMLWKLRGLATKTTYRLFSKFGNPTYCDDRFIDFSKRFKETFAIPLLESHLQQVFKRKTSFVGSKTLNFALKYVQQSVKLPITMKVLLPFVPQILYEIIIPIMMVTHKDVTLFKEDSIEFIRKQNDFTESLFTPKNTVVDLLISLCSYKSNKKIKKPDFLQGFLEFCVSNLNQYNQQQSPDWRIKEAILYAIGSLYDDLIALRAIRLSLEGMMQQHVLGELVSPQPFLKMRATWMYGQFGTFKFKNNDHLKQAIQHIYQQLHDPELPVRLTAATSIHKLLHSEEIAVLLKPGLKDILTIYLKMMSEIDSEELVSALEEIVSHFKDDIAPFALELSQQLVSSYTRLSQVSADDDDGESALAAVGCVTAVRRILDSIQKNKELLQAVEANVYPMLLHSLTPDGLDSIEDGLDCIALILYHGSQQGVSAHMWKIFPQLLFIITGDEDPDGGYGYEYLSQVAVSIQNYIAKDPVNFLAIGEGQTQTHIAMTFKLIEKSLKINRESPDKVDGIVIMKILIAMLENLQGRIDEAIPYILQICLAELAQPKIPKNYKSMLIQVISMCFWYNNALTFQILESSQQTIPVFQNLLQTLPDLKRDFELRRVIFGLTSIISTNPQQLPPVVNERLPDIMKQLAQLTLKMREERLEVLKDNEEALAEEEKNKGKGDDDEEDDDEDEKEEGESILEKAKQQKEEQQVEDGGDEDDDDEDSDYEYTGGDLAIYDSALDQVDELIFVKETLEKINAQDNGSGYVVRLMSSLGENDLQAKFNENMQNAQLLKEREEVVRKQCDEMFDNKKYR